MQIPEPPSLQAGILGRERIAGRHPRGCSQDAAHRPRSVFRLNRVMAAASTSLRPSPVLPALTAITAIAGALRFFPLGRQSFWVDEGYTAYLLQQTGGKMLELLPRLESTPPLYYGAAWLWARVFGTNEVALRSLSALAGTATVPLVYLIGRRLASPRVGLVAAALTACSPVLVWYSQEARAYALLVLLCAGALLLFLRACSRSAPGALLAWATASALAIATHYYAVLAVVPQAVWLVVAHPRRRLALLATGGVAAAGAALMPLAITQRDTGHAAWIAEIPLDIRLRQLCDQFLAGFGASPLGVCVAAAAVGAGILLISRADRRERRAALAGAALGAAGMALGLTFVALGFDGLITRNVIVAWVPFALLTSAGLGARRAATAGVALTLALCSLWVATDLRVDSHASLQRPDWRRLSAALGVPHRSRVLVLERYSSELPLYLYQPRLSRLGPGQHALVREIDVVAPHGPRGRYCWWGAACNLHNAQLPVRIPRSFRPLRRGRVQDFEAERLVSPKPWRASRRAVYRELHEPSTSAVLIQRTPRARRRRVHRS